MARAKGRAGKGSGWHLQRERHSRARKYGYAGGTYANDRYRRFPKITAPLGRKSKKLPIQVTIYVPSTKGNKTISKTAFMKRAENTAKFMSKNFEGDTAVTGKGEWVEDGKVTREDIILITSSMTPTQYEKHKDDLAKFIRDKRDDWQQSTMGYEVEGDFYVFPKKVKDTDKDGVPDKFDCEPLNPKKQDMTKDEFIQKMYETDYVFDDMDLREFADEHFQNQASFEENQKNFFKFIGEEY